MRTLWFVVIVGACILGIYSGLHPWGFLTALGVHPYPGPSTPWEYQMWSGFIPAMSILTIFGGVTTHYKAINCNVKRCWRIGKYPVAGGHYKVCQIHHPEQHVRHNGASFEHIQSAHALHLLRSGLAKPKDSHES